MLIQRLDIVVGIHDAVADGLELGLELLLLLDGQRFSVLDLGFLDQDQLVFLRAALQRGQAVEHFVGVIEQAGVHGVQLHAGDGQLVVGKDDAALGDEAVAVQHAGEGFGQHALARAALAHDAKLFPGMEGIVQAADGLHLSLRRIEFHAQVPDLQDGLSLIAHSFHSLSPAYGGMVTNYCKL